MGGVAEQALAGLSTGAAPSLRILGLTLEVLWDNGKENGNYYGLVGFYRDVLGLSWGNGKEKGLAFRLLTGPDCLHMITCNLAELQEQGMLSTL